VGRPDPGFPAFTGTGSGAHTPALGQLAGTAVRDLPVGIGFHLQATRLGGRGRTEIRFSRDPDGKVRLDYQQDRPALRWLAAYRTGSAHEPTEDELFASARLGGAEAVRRDQGQAGAGAGEPGGMTRRAAPGDPAGRTGR
jgi:hypothetical protein